MSFGFFARIAFVPIGVSLVQFVLLGIGCIPFVFPLQPEYARISALSVLLFAAFLLTAVLLWTSVKGQIVEWLEGVDEVARTVKECSSGNATARSFVRTPAELGELSLGLNEMIDSLHEKGGKPCPTGSGDDLPGRASA